MRTKAPLGQASDTCVEESDERSLTSQSRLLQSTSQKSPDDLGVNKSQSHRLIVSHHSCPHPHHNHYHHCHRGPKSSADNRSSLASAARATISRPSGQVAQNCAAPDVKGFVNFSSSPVFRQNRVVSSYDLGLSLLLLLLLLLFFFVFFCCCFDQPALFVRLQHVKLKLLVLKKISRKSFPLVWSSQHNFGI